MSIVRDTDTTASGPSNQSYNGSGVTEKTKARFVTPFNRLIGALMITQERSAKATCAVQNQHVQNFSSSVRGTICRGEALDSSPFGVDPAFSISSTLYAGDLAPEDWYALSERSRAGDGTAGAPYGFFPMSYAGRKLVNRSQGANKSGQSANNASGSSLRRANTEVSGAGEVFKLYFDERIENAQAQKLLTYMTDGGFLDDNTRKVTVEMNTLNVQLNMMATFKFIFEFQVLFYTSLQ
jgi:hypothetical protein